MVALTGDSGVAMVAQARPESGADLGDDMADEKGTGASGGGGAFGWTLGALAGVGVAVTGGYFALRPPAPEPVPAVQGGPEAPAAQPDDQPGAQPVEQPAPQAAAPAAQPEATPPAPEAAPVLPSFDTVRVDGDGGTLVAGRAAPEARLSILVDGAETATALADAGGAFAALFTLPPSADARVMRLESRLADGTSLASEAEVVIAPFAPPEPAPAAVASAEPSASPAPAAEVPATAPTVLVVEGDAVRKEVPAAPVEGVVIDTIGYGATGTVEIAGRGTAGAFVRLYLDNVERATAGVAADGGWQLSLADVAPGLYTLRIDQIDGAGAVTARVETPFQREAPETVTAALAPVAAPNPTSAPAEPAGAIPLAAAPSAASPETAVEPAPATEAPAPVALGAAPEAATPATTAVIVTVQPGYSLWQIARENYGEGMLYVKVFEANKGQIRDPDLIYPGQIFTVPAPAAASD